MKKMIKAIFVLCAILFLVECKQEIKLDLSNNGQVLIVQGEISTQKDTSYVKLSQTVSYYSTDIIPTINNADVRVNGILFKSKGNGIFMPDTPYVGVINTVYNLIINYNGSTYTSSTLLDEMFDIDRVDSVFYPAGGSGPGGPGAGGPGGGGRKEGYAVQFFWTDTRTPPKYTYMRIGRTTLEILQDSFLRNIVLMDNSVTKLNTQISRELPRHYPHGDTVTAILKSCDKNMYYFLQAYQMQTSNAPGPFQIPPANLPTNIIGGAVGYFSACDVRSFRKGL